MILSSACQPWHADLPGQKPESVAINAVSYTTSRGTISLYPIGHLNLTDAIEVNRLRDFHRIEYSWAFPADSVEGVAQ